MSQHGSLFSAFSCWVHFASARGHAGNGAASSRPMTQSSSLTHLVSVWQNLLHKLLFDGGCMGQVNLIELHNQTKLASACLFSSVTFIVKVLHNGARYTENA